MDELNLEEDSPNQSIIIESVLSHFASYLSAYIPNKVHPLSARIFLETFYNLLINILWPHFSGSIATNLIIKNKMLN